jgi:hypothetical protein
VQELPCFWAILQDRMEFGIPESLQPRTNNLDQRVAIALLVIVCLTLLLAQLNASWLELW